MLKRLALTIVLAILIVRPAIAACTASQAMEKGALAWDRATVLEVRDQQRGSWLQQYILAIEPGRLSGPDVDFGKLCAQYDEIIKAANEIFGLTCKPALTTRPAIHEATALDRGYSAGTHRRRERVRSE